MNLKQRIEETYRNPEEIKELISNECRKMPVLYDNSKEEIPGQKIKNYIFPQLMKAELTRIEECNGSIELESRLATIIPTSEPIEIQWSLEAILLAKKYLNK